MKPLTFATITALLLPAWALAQKPAAGAAQELNLSFPALAAQATDKAEVDLDGAALAQSLELAGKTGLASGIKGVHVRHYEFAQAGAYQSSVLDPLRRQVANSAWSRFLNVKENDESTEIYMLKAEGGQPGGLLLISTEAKEVTVVELLGTAELSRLRELVDSSIRYDLKAAAAEK